MASARTGGRAIVVVPNHPRLYGTLDVALGHCERYTAAKLRDALEETGFWVEKIFDFNRMSVPGWWFNGKVLRKRRLSRVQLKMMELMMPALKRLDRLWPWRGNSLIGLGVRD